MAGLNEEEEFELLSLEREKSQFGITPGGAAVGNPALERYGAKAMRSGGNVDPALAIGGATGIGAGLGAFSKEILTGAGNLVGGSGHPYLQKIGLGLKMSGQAIGAGGRAIPAIAGAISGGAGETAGQVADMTDLGKEFPLLIGEGSRIIGGGVPPEIATAAKAFAQNVWAKVPKLSLMGQAEKALFNAAMEKFANGVPQTLTEAEKKHVAAILQGASTDDLKGIGSIMGTEADRLVDSASRQQIAAIQQAAGVKVPGAGRQMADVGGDLQQTINTRHKYALKVRSDEYSANEKARDAIVVQREGAGQFVNSTPEYNAVISELEAQLANKDVMRRSPSVQASYQKILNDLTNPETTETTKKMVQSGLNLDLVEVPGINKPISFQALDDVRRKLGDAFRGKPAEGYDAIGEKAAKDLYGKVSNIQEQFAGGKGGPQRKLLDDYADRTEGLQVFSSKYGKKSTALDQYREDTFANDPSSLPTAYFKTRASVQALKELTGNAAKVESAALEFANKELSGKKAANVRSWMTTNSEWLAETPATRRIIDNYATKLEGVERSTKNAADFAEKAMKDSKLLVGNSLPAQRAVDLIIGGNTEMWAKVIPVIQQSPQAKTMMVNAVRQVVADQATSKSTAKLFELNIRPFIEGSGIGTTSEMDFIAGKLADIAAKNIPEAEKLGIARRVVLQAAAGWASTGGARAGEKTYQWSKEKMVPD